MTSHEVQTALDALAAEEQLLRHQGARADATGIDPLDIVGTASKATRDRRLAEIARERDALTAAPAPEDDGTVTAEVCVQRSVITVHTGTLHVQLRVVNDGDEPVRIRSIQLHAAPAGGAVVPPSQDFVDAASPKVEPASDLYLPSSIAFIAPGKYVVGARVQLTDGRVVDAVTATLTARPIE